MLNLTTRRAAFGAALAAFAAAPIALSTLAPAEPQTVEIIITVNKLKPLDKADELSAGDFLARMRIDNEVVATKEVSAKKEFKPKDWKLVKKVSPGEHMVKFEIIDKDVSADDPIDINRVANKRDLDFAVDTKSCTISGFSESYRCGKSITRAGAEPKKAEVTFTVTVKK